MDSAKLASDAMASSFGGLPTSEDVRSIGDIIRDTRNLNAEQVERILAHQRTHGLRFGEAAIALGLATPDDVLHALAEQFNYAYGGAERQKSSPELVCLNQPFGQQAEAFRLIRSQILHRSEPVAGMASRVRKGLAVISPNSGDGKTFFCANLAVALAQLGGRTLVVDADLRGPRLHEVFGVDNKTGLSGLLAGRRGDNVIKAIAEVPNLFVLPAGGLPPNPMELVEGAAFGLLMMELGSKFDHLVVDTPAIQYGADATIVAARCAQALIVARKDTARIADLQELTQMLTATTTHVVGVVMNNF
jgi:chain length determinant protein tyrosine kinase EpsG